VLEAATGEEALRLSRQHEGRIDLLVTDVIMPGMNGAELAGQICAGRKSCRVLFISGYTDDSLQRYGVLEPAAGFLQKPFTPNSLMEKVRLVMKSGQSDSTR
jgi:two-component system cell cycle sensor histidine kinase/response regulator CckA